MPARDRRSRVYLPHTSSTTPNGYIQQQQLPVFRLERQRTGRTTARPLVADAANRNDSVCECETEPDTKIRKT